MKLGVQQFSIEGRKVGGGAQTYIIAEVAQAHDGSLGTAHAYIDAVADAGADAVKFQTHLALHESTLDEQFRIKFSHQDATRFDYWRRMEFTPEQWQGLYDHAQSRGITFLSSPFSVEAADMLQKIGVVAWKVGSGEANQENPLLKRLAQSGLPILLSTGLSTFEQTGEIVESLRAANLPFCLLQCTSRYPSPLEEVGFNVVEEYRRRFTCPAGLSDHSGTLWPGLAAVARRADVLEFHVVFDRRMFGPDVKASITIDELATMVKFRNACATMDANPVDKDAAAIAMGGMRELFGKSIAAVSDLKAGTVLTEGLLTAKKPGSGIPYSEISEVVGRKLVSDVSAARLLSWSDLEPQA
jgi:N-acetylneuraminate synthase